MDEAMDERDDERDTGFGLDSGFLCARGSLGRSAGREGGKGAGGGGGAVAAALIWCPVGRFTIGALDCEALDGGGGGGETVDRAGTRMGWGRRAGAATGVEESCRLLLCAGKSGDWDCGTGLETTGERGFVTMFCDLRSARGAVGRLDIRCASAGEFRLSY